MLAARATCCRCPPSRWTAPGRRRPRGGRSGTSPLEIPVWDATLCIQCNKCALVCPHAAIRAKVYEPAALAGAPRASSRIAFKAADLPGPRVHAPGGARGLHRLQPVRRGLPGEGQDQPAPQGDRHGSRSAPLRDCRASELRLLPRPARGGPHHAARSTSRARSSSQPLFEYSGACAGCGETPYVKLLTQLFGDRAADRQRHRLLVDLRRQPADHALHGEREGRGPAWANSLFEDNAEFGLGFRLAVGQHARAGRGAAAARSRAGSATALVAELLAARPDRARPGIAGAAASASRRCATGCRAIAGPEARAAGALADYLVKKSVWIVGGDGWAYDIGFGGLDHVLSTGRNVNILVLDTEVYSNTGGQQSKATPLGAAAKFAAAGKAIAEEGPGPAGDELRQRLRGAGRLRRQGRPDGAGVARRPRPTPGRR